MDYSLLSRKELQALCKKCGIPANASNAYMAEALGALQDAPDECKPFVKSIPSLGEVVKSAKRPTRPMSQAVKLEASEVDDLSSKLTKSTILNGISFEEMQLNWRSATVDTVLNSDTQRVTFAQVEKAGKTSTKVEPISPIRLHVLEDGIEPPTTRVTTGAALGIPALGVANDSVATQGIPQRGVVEAVKGCQHRIGRKFGKSCKSCAFEKRVASIMQDMLQNLNTPKVGFSFVS